MLLTSLRLRKFRNYDSLELLPGNGVNVLFGSNAQGKTNVLEAIHVLARRTSHRAERDAELIKWGEEHFSVFGRFEQDDTSFSIEVSYGENKAKSVKINGLSRKAAEKLFPEVQVVLFIPDDLQMVKGPASMRRDFIDQQISQVSASYAYDLSKYQKAVSQRNSLLRNGLAPTDPLVMSFTDQMVIYGSALYKKRIAALKRLVPVAQRVHADLTRGEKLDIAYRPSVHVTGGETDDLIRDLFVKRLRERAELERIKGMTLVGPHRDDIVFSIQGKDARQFGSQGQQRSIVVSMKVSELHYVRQETGRFPVLLLDDILSELDASRRQGLLAAVTEEIQVFLTCTDYSPFESLLPRQTSYYKVSAGAVEEHHGG